MTPPVYIYVHRKLQRGLSAVEKCERWKIKMKIRLRPSTFLIDLGPLRFILHAKYLGVIFDERITLRLHIDMTDRIYFLFKSEGLSANIN
jgi:hypothetical protein